MENEPLLTETVLTALKRHRNGQVFLFNQALSCWDMVPGTWQSAGLRTKATREGRIGEPRRSKAGARLPPKPVLTLGFPPHEAHETSLCEAGGVRTLNSLQQKAFLPTGFW